MFCISQYKYSIVDEDVRESECFLKFSKFIVHLLQLGLLDQRQQVCVRSVQRTVALFGSL